MVVPEGPVDQCRTDREDTRHRMDARPITDANAPIRDAWQLVGCARRGLFQSVRAARAHNELLSGIPSSPAEQYAAPYSITEEFTAVYRLHSLIPDDFSFRNHTDDNERLACTFQDLFAGGTTKIQHEIPFEDVLYSLGTSCPGAPVLHNYPNHLRRLPENINLIKTDLAATDIIRDRERGVPRYCAFRRPETGRAALDPD